MSILTTKEKGKLLKHIRWNLLESQILDHFDLQNVCSILLFSHSVVSNSLQSHGLQHTRLPCPSPSPRAWSNSCPLSWWCHPTISSSVVPFSSCLQSFPASGSSPMSQFFTSAGQSTGVSASASVLPMNMQDWFPLGWTGLIFLQSRGLSRVFSNTTVQKHQCAKFTVCMKSALYEGIRCMWVHGCTTDTFFMGQDLLEVLSCYSPQRKSISFNLIGIK